MSEIIRVRGKYYILAGSALADDRARVLKHGDTFAVFDRHGDIQPVGLMNQGLYHEGTRFLSRLELRLGGQRPLLLGSTVQEDNALMAVDVTNPDLFADGAAILPRDTLHLFRSAFLWEGVCYLRLRLRSYDTYPVELSLTLTFAADFADIFEVRGLERVRRGSMLSPQVDRDTLVLGYEGLDGVVRSTRLDFNPTPDSVGAAEARYAVSLPPLGGRTLFITVSCEAGVRRGGPPPYEVAARAVGTALRDSEVRACDIYTSNEQFNHWLGRSAADLRMMLTDTPTGPYPYAGVPWFSTAFGRDGIITALETLWVDPNIAAGVLRFLAATQATEVKPEQDAEPGKILHETRRGELAALGEIPFGLYYGTIDATPLFVALAGAYYERTGDRQLITQLWPNVKRALEWIDQYGDLDGDGFLEYVRRPESGLQNQGWKDSEDSVFHEDGALAKGAIALCEVQAYVYGAKRAAAGLAELLGYNVRAVELRDQARTLAERFEQTFWCEGLGTYALALDGDKRACRVRTSNAGHCLLTGIASSARAAAVAETLMSTESFSGWGVRTVAESEKRYNPMSYHNGSVWPHDNALIALGLARSQMKEAALRIFTGLMDASLFADLHRLPELFCGFARRLGQGPTRYPVACSPQAWASGAVYLLLQACLGLSIDATKGQLLFSYPLLPPFLRWVRIRNLTVGKASVDLELTRHEQDVGINVVRRQGELQVVVVK